MRKVTILKYAKKLLFKKIIDFSCIAIRLSIRRNLGIYYDDKTEKIVQELFPKFNYKYALEAGFARPGNDYVWFDNDKDRVEFLDHLISIYKDDKTDIKKKFKIYKNGK